MFIDQTLILKALGVLAFTATTFSFLKLFLSKTARHSVAQAFFFSIALAPLVLLFTILFSPFVGLYVVSFSIDNFKKPYEERKV